MKFYFQEKQINVLYNSYSLGDNNDILMNYEMHIKVKGNLFYW